ncbi:MAG: ABC transporter substrate-binding protein [Alphaproteobacteria bacterium]|nr:MAG: ABC transporter substrate-binding protein [Alphaproteobacteria bacterium]
MIAPRGLGILGLVLAVLAMPGMASAQAATVNKAASIAAKSADSEPRFAGWDSVTRLHKALQSITAKGATTSYDKRVAVLGPVVRTVFDMTSMTRLVMGPAWQSANPAQRTQLRNAFEDFTIANYARRFSFQGDVRFEEIGQREPPARDEALLMTRLLPPGDRNIRLDYRMRLDPAAKAWKIMDVFVDGTISEAATRRGEFGSVYRSAGIDGLLKMIQDKTQQLAQAGS